VARIVGVDLPRDKRVLIGLTYIYGIGRSLSTRILQLANVDVSVRVRELTDDEITRITSVIQHECVVEGDLRREINMNVKRLMDIGCYRGLRHRRGLPVRGQRTRTNSRTRKGPRRTIGVRAKK